MPNLDLTTVLNLDPYFSADSSFNPDDLVAGALAQLQRGGRTWGYPLVIEPQVIHYYADILSKAGVPLPTNGVWTADQFANALTTLQATLPSDKKAFANRTPGDTALLELIAAFGGLPLDFRTDPPTINFTDPGHRLGHPAGARSGEKRRHGLSGAGIQLVQYHRQSRR